MKLMIPNYPSRLARELTNDDTSLYSTNYTTPPLSLLMQPCRNSTIQHSLEILSGHVAPDEKKILEYTTRDTNTFLQPESALSQHKAGPLPGQALFNLCM